MTSEPRWVVVQRWSNGTVQYLMTMGASHAMQMFVGVEDKAALFTSQAEADCIAARWQERTAARNPHPWLGTGNVTAERIGRALAA